ncbi:Bifunctional purine biosynthesis protein PurH [Blastocladiella emersonii ATCC 22665]|nr:Bifunctional purine biosynthesis protein PurH [Blastocladiella emersonii ATCC 22665]
MTTLLYVSAFTASIGMYHFGYHLGELNNIARILPCIDAKLDGDYPSFLNLPPCIPMGTTAYSFGTAMIALAGSFGALWSGSVVNKYGRKRLMQILNVPMMIGALLLTFMSNYAMLLLGRFFAGFATGGMSVAVPIYLSEISPVNLRGPIGISSVLGLGSGLAIAGLLGYFFSAPPYWRIIVGATIISTLLHVVLLPFIPESPVHLKSVGKTAEAEAVMEKLGHAVTKSASGSHSDLASAEANKEAEPEGPMDPTPTLWEFLTKPEHRRSLLVLILSHATQQLSGINVYFSYSFVVLILVFTQEQANLFYVFFSFYYILVALVPSFLLERYGRRPLTLLSIFSMAGFAALFALSVEVFDLPYLALFAFIAAATVFAFGLSSIPFIMTAEVVHPSVVGVASQVSLATNTFSNFIILFIFPMILDVLKGWTFLIFTVYLGLMGLIGLRILPETKGKTPFQVVAELRAK